MQTLHNILTQTIALFSIAAPILFAVVAVDTGTLKAALTELLRA